ncbi:MAG: hypothetical protein ACLS6G_11105 [Christensenellales bacterium]
MCEEFVLSNGLQVVAEPIEISIRRRRPWIGAGSMYESAEENGLSLLCGAHPVKSTERRTTETSPWRWMRWADR